MTNRLVKVEATTHQNTEVSIQFNLLLRHEFKLCYKNDLFEYVYIGPVSDVLNAENVLAGRT